MCTCSKVFTAGDVISLMSIVKTGRLRGVLPDPSGCDRLRKPAQGAVFCVFRPHAKYNPGDVLAAGCSLPQRRQYRLRQDS